MFYVYNEEEHKQLIHKERIKLPVKEFTDGLVNDFNKHLIPYNHPELEGFISDVKLRLQTLSVKLDL